MKVIQIIILFLACVIAVTYVEIENIRWMFDDAITWRYFKLGLAVVAVISIAILAFRNGVVKTLTGLSFWLILVFIGVLVYHSWGDIVKVFS